MIEKRRPGGRHPGPEQLSPTESVVLLADRNRQSKRKSATSREVDEHRLIAFIGDAVKYLKMARTAGLRPEHFKNELYAEAFGVFCSDGHIVSERITLGSPRPPIVEWGEASALIEKLKAMPAEKPPLPPGAALTSAADRAKWYDQVLSGIEAKELTALAFVVAVLIGKRADNKTGVAFPGYAYLAKKAAVSVRSVQDVVHRLEDRGHLRIDHFTLTLRPAAP